MATKFRELFEIRSDSPDCGDEGQPECPLDPDRPSLTNRAIQGQYNMGSAFKVFVAWSALHTGLISADDYITRQRYVQGRDRSPTTSAPRGSSVCGATRSARGSTGPCRYGPINMQLSLAVSSDVYYYRLGEKFFITPGTDHLLLQDELAQLRVRRGDRHRPALRVRRPPPRSRDEGGARRERSPGEG